MKKIDYSDILDNLWRVSYIRKSSPTGVIFCGKVIVMAGVVRAYADHVVMLHNAFVTEKHLKEMEVK